MKPNKALITAAAVAATMVAASTAMAINGGIIGASADRVGTLTPTGATVQPGDAPSSSYTESRSSEHDSDERYESHDDDHHEYEGYEDDD